MKRLRYWTAILSIWLIFFFNIERILLEAKVNLIQSYTYIFVALMLLLPLMFPRLRGTLFAILVGLSVSVFLILWYNQPILRKLPLLAMSDVTNITLLTIIQVSAIILTSLLARQINAVLMEFEEVIANITFNHIGARPKPFDQAQGGMYRELKRARYYQRPLSVVALSVDEASIQANLPRVVKEVQQGLMKEYVLAKMGRILDQKLHHFNVIALRDNAFVIVLPEASKIEANETALHLEEALKAQMDVALQIGSASFPDDAITFEKLIEQAMDNVRPIHIVPSALAPENSVMVPAPEG